jgi:hypothetical protein
VRAQTYTHDLANSADNAIDFTLSRSEISVAGYDGNQITIENTDYEAPPERAEGLRPLYGGGPDNTGIGLSIEEENGVLNIVQARPSDGNFVVRVPDNIRLTINEANWGGGDIVISNHKGEIEIRAKNADINLSNISGPVIAHSTSGDVDIEFSSVSAATPSSISLVSGYIDVTMPASTKANMKLGSVSGEIYSDLDLQMKGGKEDLQRWGGGSTIEGTLNGGGVEMALKTVSGDIYLRKK